jgi:uncharacterized repeat protein (TIGR02543 family)
MYYKYEGLPITLTLSKTVSVSEEKAQSIADTVSKSVSSTSSWAGTKSFSETNSENWNSHIGVGIEGEIGSGALLEKVCNWSVKGKVEYSYDWGGENSTTEGWTNSMSGSYGETDTTSHSVSTSIAYREEITSEITESITISADLPSGYYAYVHAGNIRVIAVLSYEIATGCLYLNTYSRLDNMHAMMMYYPNVNELNNPSVEGLDFTVPEDEIVKMIENSYYVKYDANGGQGTMPTTIHSAGVASDLVANEFTRPGYVFAGWELETDDGVRIFQDGQSVTDLAKPLNTVTLKAMWTENTIADPTPITTTKTGWVSKSSSSNPGLKYSAVIECRNRTATTVEVRITWTATIVKGDYDRYGQYFKFSSGSASSGNVKVVSFDKWKNSASSDRSETASSAWITVPVSSASATSVDLSVYYWQTNSNGTDMYKYDGTPCVKATWTVNIPAYQ